ncbi:MAG: hypothetical protein ACI4VX_00330 [Succinivibrionaceae bacterium]
MKIVIKVLTILFLLLLIAAGCIYLYVSSNYIIKPLTKMIKDETGITLSIGSIDYNPIYPDFIVLKNVSADSFFSAEQIYMEFDSGKLLNRKLLINDLELINAKANFDLLPEIKNSGKLVDSIFIQKLIIKNSTASAKKWSIENGIAEISNLNLFSNGAFKIIDNFSMTLFAERLSYDDVTLHGINTLLQASSGKIRLLEFKGNYKDAYIAGNLSIMPDRQEITMEDMQIRNLDFSLNDDIYNFADHWKIRIKNTSLINCSIRDQLSQLFLEGIDLEVSSITLNKNSLEKAYISGSMESLRYGNTISYSLSADLSRISPDNPVNILISGKLFGGTFETFAKYFPQNSKLIISDFTGNSFRIQASGATDFKESLDNLPVNDINANLIQITGIVYDSLDENDPILFRNGSIFMERIKYNRQQLTSAKKKSHLNISADELSFPYISLSNLDINTKISNTGVLQDLQAVAEVNKGNVTVSGLISFPDKTLDINMQGAGIGFNVLNLLADRKDIIGNTDLDLHITGGFETSQRRYDGWIKINDALYANIDLEKMVTGDYANLEEQLQDAGNTAKNLLINTARLNLKSTGEGQEIDGTIDTVRSEFLIKGVINNSPLAEQKVLAIQKTQPQTENHTEHTEETARMDTAEHQNTSSP